MKQKAAKKAAKDMQQPEKSKTKESPMEVEPQSPQRGAHSQRQVQAEEMTGNERAAAETAAYLIAASMEHPASVRMQRTAKLGRKAWQLTVPTGTVVAAAMSEQQLGHALAAAHSGKQRGALLHKEVQQTGRPQPASPAGEAAQTTQKKWGPAATAGSQMDNGFELYDQ